MTEPTDAELDAVLCKHWPAFSMQATLVRMWVRAAMRAAIVKWGTPPAEQAAPKAAPGVGNSGFDHQTAADFLSGKTVSDEAVRKFVAESRWAHNERAALSATLLAMHGVLTSREAEIALLKKALLEAEAAPQPAPAPLSDDTERLEWLLWKLPGDALRYVVGELADTSSGSEFRAAIDAALAAQGGK